MREFVKNKKGKISIGVIVLLILIGIIYSCSSEKDDKHPIDIAVESEKSEGSKTQQDNMEDTGDGLEVGDSLSESEDTLSVSGGETQEDKGNHSTLSDKEFQNSESVQEDENAESDNAASEQTFGDLY